MLPARRSPRRPRQATATTLSWKRALVPSGAAVRRSPHACAPSSEAATMSFTASTALSVSASNALTSFLISSGERSRLDTARVERQHACTAPRRPKYTTTRSDDTTSSPHRAEISKRRQDDLTHALRGSATSDVITVWSTARCCHSEARRCDRSVARGRGTRTAQRQSRHRDELRKRTATHPVAGVQVSPEHGAGMGHGM